MAITNVHLSAPSSEDQTASFVLRARGLCRAPCRRKLGELEFLRKRSVVAYARSHPLAYGISLQADQVGEIRSIYPEVSGPPAWRVTGLTPTRRARRCRRVYSRTKAVPGGY